MRFDKGSTYPRNDTDIDTYRGHRHRYRYWCRFIAVAANVVVIIIVIIIVFNTIEFMHYSFLFGKAVCSSVRSITNIRLFPINVACMAILNAEPTPHRRVRANAKTKTKNSPVHP